MWPALLHASDIQSDFFGKRLQLPPSGICVVQAAGVPTCRVLPTWRWFIRQTAESFSHFQQACLHLQVVNKDAGGRKTVHKSLSSIPADLGELEGGEPQG